MAAKKARRVPTELKAIQDERLTCRHIKALMQLQQTTDENEELKSKLKTLEKEVSSCQELHQIARDSEKRLKTLDKDWRITMEKSLSELRAQHKKKIIELLAADEKSRKNRELQQTEFEMKIKELESQVENLKREEAEQINDKETIKELKTKLSESNVMLADAEAVAKKLDCQLQQNMAKEDSYMRERNSSKSVIDSLERQLENLSLTLSSEMEAKKKLIEQSDLLKELEKQRCLIESFEKERATYESNVEELKLDLSNHMKRIEELERENMIIQLEREALHQSSTDLQKEVEYLKEKEAGLKSSSNGFQKYVNVKRELVSLKEENTKLKSAASRIEIKTLKNEEPKSKRSNLRSTSSVRRL